MQVPANTTRAGRFTASGPRCVCLSRLWSLRSDIRAVSSRMATLRAETGVERNGSGTATAGCPSRVQHRDAIRFGAVDQLDGVGAAATGTGNKQVIPGPSSLHGVIPLLGCGAIGSDERTGRLPSVRGLPRLPQRSKMFQGIAVGHPQWHPDPGPPHLLVGNPQEVAGGDVIVEDHQH